MTLREWWIVNRPGWITNRVQRRESERRLREAHAEAMENIKAEHERLHSRVAEALSEYTANIDKAFQEMTRQGNVWNSR